MRILIISLRIMVALLCIATSALPAQALQAAPYTPSLPKTDGPVIISGYSFSGGRMNYVQLFNSSDELVNLADWHLEYQLAGQTTPVILTKLHSLMVPSGYVLQPTQAFYHQQTLAMRRLVLLTSRRRKAPLLLSGWCRMRRRRILRMWLAHLRLPKAPIGSATSLLSPANTSVRLLPLPRRMTTSSMPAACMNLPTPRLCRLPKLWRIRGTAHPLIPVLTVQTM